MNRKPSGAHLFSVDVEEYFQVNAFDGFIERTSWDSYPSRIERPMEVLLELLAANDATATFFTLGWIAERHPPLVRRIIEGGHEVASHGYWHRRVPELDPATFREDVRRSRQQLEDVGGTAVHGFRAPSFSIIPGCEWALEILVEEGYTYDSSRFPIFRPGYGSPGTPRDPHRIACAAGGLLEFPPATARIAGATLPAAGGGYLRQFPLALMKRALLQAEARGVPAMVYIHPWELDPDQPRLPAGRLTRIRHYRNLERTQGRLEELLREFRFSSVRGASFRLQDESEQAASARLPS